MPSAIFINSTLLFELFALWKEIYLGRDPRATERGFTSGVPREEGVYQPKGLPNGERQNVRGCA